MGLFDFFHKKPGKHKADAEQEDADAAKAEEATEAEQAEEKHGPWDISEEAEIPDQSYLDLGALKIPARQDTKVQLGISEDRTRILAVTLTHAGSSMQLSLLAASSDQPLWDEVRASISQGKTPKQIDTRFGKGVAVEVGLPNGSIVPTKIMGIDGPRWMLRAIVTGDAAQGGEQGQFFDDLLADVVVDRGETPLAPKEIIPLTAPGASEGNQDSPDGQGSDDETPNQGDSQNASASSDGKTGIPDSRSKGPLHKGMNAQQQQILTRRTMFSEVR